MILKSRASEHVALFAVVTLHDCTLVPSLTTFRVCVCAKRYEVGVSFSPPVNTVNTWMKPNKTRTVYNILELTNAYYVNTYPNHIHVNRHYLKICLFASKIIISRTKRFDRSNDSYGWWVRYYTAKTGLTRNLFRCFSFEDLFIIIYFDRLYYLVSDLYHALWRRTAMFSARVYVYGPSTR